MIDSKDSVANSNVLVVLKLWMSKQPDRKGASPVRGTLTGLTFSGEAPPLTAQQMRIKPSVNKQAIFCVFPAVKLVCVYTNTCEGSLWLQW